MSEPRHHQLEIASDGGGLAVLTLDMKDKSTNVLNMELVAELTQTMRRVAEMEKITGVLIRSAKPRQFIAGADVHEIFQLTDADEASEKSALGQALMDAIEKCHVPTVAAIDGACLGGGLELALACTYRVAGEGDHVAMSLPEVRLGIIPGFGGTQRAPKIVGLIHALDLILSSRTMNGRQALKIGLVDDLAPSSILEQVARKLLTRTQPFRRPSKISMSSKWMERVAPLRRWVFRKAREKVLKTTSGFYPAPLAAIDVIEKTFHRDTLLSYETEAAKVGQLIVSPVTKSLVSLFFATEEIRKADLPGTAIPIKEAGVLGAGIMGAAIAGLLAAKDRQVRLKDVSPEFLAKGLRTLADANRKLVRRKKISERQAQRRWGRISPTVTTTGFRRVQIIIEAVAENLDIKRKVFRELSQSTPESTVLATNTSALSIAQIAQDLPHPERVVGMHFFNPVDRMPLVEVIRGPQTSENAIATVYKLALELGKTPIIVADQPGFLVNRILGTYLNEACRMTDEGTPVEIVDDVMRKFGMPMGPFELMDQIGLDIADEVGQYLSRTLVHFGEPGKRLHQIRQAGHFGRKNGRGFYAYDARGHMKKTKETSSPENRTDRYQATVDRLILVMVNEAARCLADGVVTSIRDIDVGMVLGTGFAPFRGGLVRYAASLGQVEVRGKLSRLADQFGRHFSPAPEIDKLFNGVTLPVFQPENSTRPQTQLTFETAS